MGPRALQLENGNYNYFFFPGAGLDKPNWYHFRPCLSTKGGNVQQKEIRDVPRNPVLLGLLQKTKVSPFRTTLLRIATE